MTEHTYLVGTHAGLFHIRLTNELELSECTRLYPGHHYALSVHPSKGLIYSKNQDAYLDVVCLDTLAKIETVVLNSAPG